MIFEPEEEPPKIKFRIVGMVISPEFQLCRCYAERLYKSLPKEYHEPDLRPLLNVEWHTFLKKIRRRIGGEKLWAYKKSVVIFQNGEFMGDDTDLLRYISNRYRMAITKDFYKLGNEGLIEHLTKQSELGRSFVYFMIAVDDRVIGSLLFLIYADLVPQISEIFTRRCLRNRGGYTGTFIHRIAKPSWIQCGGYGLKHHQVPCENYVIAHDRRGVLSMCHNGKHTDNSTQFFITLEPTPWMDYKYVAFGQLIQGEEILQILENTPTSYEAPLRKIQIVKSDEFTLCPKPDLNARAEMEKHFSYINFYGIHADVTDPRDADSAILRRRRYNKGLYSASTDMQSHLPFLHLPDYLIYKYLIEKIAEEPVEEECCKEEVKHVSIKEKPLLQVVKESRHISQSFLTATTTDTDVTTTTDAVGTVSGVSEIPGVHDYLEHEEYEEDIHAREEHNSDIF